MKLIVFSCPGFTISNHPPGKYLPGFPPKFNTNMYRDVNSVENAKRANP